MPKVSVVVPCYNVAPWLSRCMDSLINQTLKDIEIICIDDKSTDNTRDILHNYAEQDCRIRVIEQKQNGGVSVARNTGIDVASGEYIGFVDPDDYVDLDFFNTLYNMAARDNLDIAKGKLQTLMPDGHIIILQPNSTIHTQYDFSINFSSAIYRREILNSNNIRFIQNLALGEDVIFLTQVVISSARFNKTDDVSYWYIRRDGSLDTIDRQISPDNISTCIDRYKNMLHMTANPNIAPDAIAYISSQSYKLTQWLFNKNTATAVRENVIQALLWIYHNSTNTSRIDRTTKSAIVRSLREKNYKQLFLEICRKKTRYKLFGFIPVLTIIRYANIQTTWNLFELLPVICTRRDVHQTKIYLFNILILKIKR